MKILHVIASLFLLFSTASWAASSPTAAILPPKYLSVPDWKNCVGEVTRGSAQFICLPAKKPKGCPYRSWKKLHKLNEIDPC